MSFVYVSIGGMNPTLPRIIDQAQVLSHLSAEFFERNQLGAQQRISEDHLDNLGHAAMAPIPASTPTYPALVHGPCVRCFMETQPRGGQERNGREEILSFASYNLFAFPYAPQMQPAAGGAVGGRPTGCEVFQAS